jgi:hypothetical protein
MRNEKDIQWDFISPFSFLNYQLQKLIHAANVLANNIKL